MSQVWRKLNQSYLDIIGKKILCRANQSLIVSLIYFILKSFKTFLLFSKPNVMILNRVRRRSAQKSPEWVLSVYQRTNWTPIGRKPCGDTPGSDWHTSWSNTDRFPAGAWTTAPAVSLLKHYLFITSIGSLWQNHFTYHMLYSFPRTLD